MKIHIENLTIHQPSHGLLAMLGSIRKMDAGIPALGEKWQDTDAIYAGVSLSKDGDKLVHMILWNVQPSERMKHEEGVKWAEGVCPDMNSHMPTRHQIIDLYERLQDKFKTDDWHWTLTKRNDGAAFVQGFSYGGQDLSYLGVSGWARAVSEIPL